MSTNIATIYGEREAVIQPQKGKVQKSRQTMSITRFWGGSQNGVMLQLTIGNWYIQIDSKGIEELKEVLNNYHDMNEEEET
jgi:hypothetical protein